MSRRNAAENAAGNAAAPAVPGVRPARRKSWLRRHGVTLFLVLMLLVGLGLLLYPSVANWWNNMHQSRVVEQYASAVSQTDAERAEKLLKDARAYNRELAKTGERWFMTDAETREYNSLLDVTGTGVMAYLTIPKINVQLPVYHGTDDAVLQTSIGHLSGTSLPVGGKSSHCVLSGHRGLPSARLFTDLDQLAEGDTFTLNVLDETLTYEVDQIRIVEPDDISDLQIEPGKDLCTLVTCTPYGINTQRLLVRGHRIPNVNGDARVAADAVLLRPAYIAPFLAIPLLVLLVVFTIVASARRGKKGMIEDAVLGSLGLSRPVPELDGEELRRGRHTRDG